MRYIVAFVYILQEEKKKKREREQLENTASVPVEPFTLTKPVEVKLLICFLCLYRL